MRHTLRSRGQGFTLIELLIVAPFAILLISGLIVMATQATNSALRSYGQTKIQGEVMYALDQIEQDVRSSVDISSASTSSLSIDGVATTLNPQDPARKLINFSDCSVTDVAVDMSNVTKYNLRYEINAGRLERKTDFTGKWCSGNPTMHAGVVWQREGSEILIDGATTTISVQYSSTSGVPTAIPDTIVVTLASTRVVAGQDVSFTAERRIKSTNL